MRQWEKKKKNSLCLPKHNYMDPHCFDADPDPAKNLNADPDPDPDPGGGGVGQPKMCIPPGKILGTPLDTGMDVSFFTLRINQQVRYWYRCLFQ
jgi:hypothetical protein